MTAGDLIKWIVGALLSVVLFLGGALLQGQHDARVYGERLARLEEHDAAQRALLEKVADKIDRVQVTVQGPPAPGCISESAHTLGGR